MFPAADDLPLTVSQVAARLPGARGAARVSTSTITRWITGGCPGRTGERVKLVATRAGGRWLVHPRDLAEFFRLLAADLTTAPATEGDVRARHAAAALEAQGA